MSIFKLANFNVFKNGSSVPILNTILFPISSDSGEKVSVVSNYVDLLLKINTFTIDSQYLLAKMLISYGYTLVLVRVNYTPDYTTLRLVTYDDSDIPDQVYFDTNKNYEVVTNSLKGIDNLEDSNLVLSMSLDFTDWMGLPDNLPDVNEYFICKQGNYSYLFWFTDGTTPSIIDGVSALPPSYMYDYTIKIDCSSGKTRSIQFLQIISMLELVVGYNVEVNESIIKCSLVSNNPSSDQQIDPTYLPGFPVTSVNTVGDLTIEHSEFDDYDCMVQSSLNQSVIDFTSKIPTNAKDLSILMSYTGSDLLITVRKYNSSGIIYEEQFQGSPNSTDTNYILNELSNSSLITASISNPDKNKLIKVSDGNERFLGYLKDPKIAEEVDYIKALSSIDFEGLGISFDFLIDSGFVSRPFHDKLSELATILDAIALFSDNSVYTNPVIGQCCYFYPNLIISGVEIPSYQAFLDAVSTGIFEGDYPVNNLLSQPKLDPSVFSNTSLIHYVDYGYIIESPKIFSGYNLISAYSMITGILVDNFITNYCESNILSSNSDSKINNLLQEVLGNYPTIIQDISLVSSTKVGRSLTIILQISFFDEPIYNYLITVNLNV